jgi:glycyl-tRNA synthetase alpha subunit
MFLDEKFVIENDVSDFDETNNSSLSSLDKSCVKTIEIEEEKEERKHFNFEFFAIDFVLKCCHVSEIENLRNVVALMKKSRKYQKIIVKKKKKKRMTFKTFNQYRENRSISNESDINLAKRKLSKSSSHQKKTAFVLKELEQFRFSTTMTSLQALQMLFR